jgi:hypothetical protein
MMNTQLYRNGTQRLGAAQALQLGRLGGELTVVEGRVWLTRDNDLGDFLVEPGQRVRLAVGENGVIESLDARHDVLLRWNPRRQSFIGALIAEPLRGAAFLTGVAARGFAALARSAAAGACRAQGSISGESSQRSTG